MTEQQWCCGCMQWLPLEAFMVQSGVAGRCRSCRAEHLRQWRAANPEYVAAYNERRRIGIRERQYVTCGARFTAGKRGPAGKRCAGCRRQRKLEQRRRRREGAAVGEKAPASRSPENRVGRAAV